MMLKETTDTRGVTYQVRAKEPWEGIAATLKSEFAQVCMPK